MDTRVSIGWSIATMVAACTPATTQIGTGGSDSSSTTADTDDPSVSSTIDPETTGDPPADTSTSTTAITTADTTDGTTGDPTLVCGLGEGILLPGPFAILGSLATPIELDGGDLLFAEYGSVVRGSAAGEQLWESFGDADDYARRLALVDGYAWAGWRMDHETNVRAAITLHDLESGDVIDEIDVSETSVTYDAYVVAAPDGTLVVSALEAAEGDTYRTVIQGRTPDAGELLWSITPPTPDGQLSTSVVNIAMDAEGFFGTGSTADEDSQRAIVMRFDGDGEHVWTWQDETTAPLAGTAWAHSPSLAPDGGIVVVASFRSGGTAPSVGNLLSDDTRVVRLDADGTATLDVATGDISGKGRVQLEGARALDDGRILIVGSQLVASNGDAWLGYLDADGVLVCDEATPDPDGIENSIAGVFVGTDGELRVHGYADEASIGENSTVRQWVSTLMPY